jgi:hypothetical protein
MHPCATSEIGRRPAYGGRKCTIMQPIERGLAKHSNREAYLSTHAYYSAEESRIINTWVLRYLFGEDTEIYKQIVEKARKEAIANLRRSIEEKRETKI